MYIWNLEIYNQLFRLFNFFNYFIFRQNTPRLSEDEVNKLLDKTKMRYYLEIKELLDDHKVNFIHHCFIQQTLDKCTYCGNIST